MVVRIRRWASKIRTEAQDAASVRSCEQHRRAAARGRQELRLGARQPRSERANVDARMGRDGYTLYLFYFAYRLSAIGSMGWVLGPAVCTSSKRLTVPGQDQSTSEQNDSRQARRRICMRAMDRLCYVGRPITACRACRRRSMLSQKSSMRPDVHPSAYSHVVVSDHFEQI